MAADRTYRALGKRACNFNAVCLLGGAGCIERALRHAKMTRETKISGVFSHQTLQPLALLTRGFDESFLAPHSRYADFPIEELRKYSDLDILVESEDAGAYLFATKDKRMAFVTGHRI